MVMSQVSWLRDFFLSLLCTICDRYSSSTAEGPICLSSELCLFGVLLVQYTLSLCSPSAFLSTERVLSFSIVSCFVHLTAKNRAKLTGIITGGIKYHAVHPPG